jgi:hypothetical protein
MTDEPAASAPPPPDDKTREDAAIARLIEVLTAEHATTRTPDEVLAAVTRAREDFADAPVRTFVPTLVERKSRALLRPST